MNRKHFFTRKQYQSFTKIQEILPSNASGCGIGGEIGSGLFDVLIATRVPVPLVETAPVLHLGVVDTVLIEIDALHVFDDDLSLAFLGPIVDQHLGVLAIQVRRIETTNIVYRTKIFGFE